MKKEDMNFWKSISYKIIEEVEKSISPLVGDAKAGKVLKIGADGTPTKFIDDVAEKNVIEVLKSSQRAITLISEEIGELKIGNGPSEAIFIVDPLDGTANAVKNIPAYGISIAMAFPSDFTINGIKMGFVKNIATGDLYEAIKCQGAYLNGGEITPSKQEDIARSSIGTYIRGLKMKKMDKICNTVERIRLLGSVAIELCYVADGTYDAFFDIRGNLRIIDLAAAKLILEEVGCIITNGNGKVLNNPLNVKERTSVIAACNLNIHKNIMNMVGV